MTNGYSGVRIFSPAPGFCGASNGTRVDLTDVLYSAWRLVGGSAQFGHKGNPVAFTDPSLS